MSGHVVLLLILCAAGADKKSPAEISRMLASSDATMRREAVNFVEGIGAKRAEQYHDEVQKLLKDSDPYIRVVAANIVARGQNPDAALKVLVDALHSEDSRVRIHAAERIGWLGKAAASTVPAILEAWKDKRISTATAFYSLFRMGEQAAPALDVFEAALQDKRLSQTACRQLAKVGRAAIPLLVEYARKPVPKTQRLAIRGLGKVGGEAEVSVLLELSGEESPHELKVVVVEALGSIGPAARKAVPYLVGLLDEQDFIELDVPVKVYGKVIKHHLPMAIHAASALGEIGGEEALRALTRALKGLPDPGPVFGGETPRNAMIRTAVLRAIQKIERKDETKR